MDPYRIASLLSLRQTGSVTEKVIQYGNFMLCIITKCVSLNLEEKYSGQFYGPNERHHCHWEFSENKWMRE